MKANVVVDAQRGRTLEQLLSVPKRAGRSKDFGSSKRTSRKKDGRSKQGPNLEMPVTSEKHGGMLAKILKLLTSNQK